MPKMKTNKGLAKRVRVTRRGKVVSISAGFAHRRTRKSAKQKRRLRRVRPLAPAAAKVVRKTIGPV
jgi:large subunit ribosomal protein L35